MSTADLTKATRELFVRTLLPQVMMGTPVIEKLMANNKTSFRGGKYIERLVDTATTETLVQEYTANTALSDGKMSTLDKPRFYFKYFQFPMRYDVDEYTENVTAGKEEQLLDLSQHLVTKTQRDMRKYLEKKIFNTGSTTGVADGAVGMQSLVSALDHDIVYGGITRTWGTTGAYWQGADPAALNENVSSSAQGTAYNMTISSLRKWITETSVYHNMDSPADLYVCMCPTLFNKLRAEMESKMIYQPAAGDTARQGFNKMYLDGNIEIVSVPYLQTTSAMRTWVFILNWKHWEFRVHTERAFKMTDFKWQGENTNGYDFWLARILVKANLICWKPNGSLWLSNVS